MPYIKKVRMRVNDNICLIQQLSNKLLLKTKKKANHFLTL